MDNQDLNTSAVEVGATTTSDAAEGTLTITPGSKNPSAMQVAQWKTQHGKLKLVQVDDMDIYFKQPTRAQVAAANQTLVKTRDASKYADIILKNCQLNFIEETAADDEIYFALSAKVDEIITSKVANLKN
jgi:hypothetical protein